MATRGRPRTDSIPRFNVDTFLSSNKKSIKFKRRVATVPAYVNNPILTVEEWTWFILARFFNYVNANCAMNACITDEDAESVAEFCRWQGEPAELLNHLRDSGFIEQDGAVHDQDDHQPLAADIKRKRAQREGNGDVKPDSGEFVPPDFDRSGGKLRNVERRSEANQRASTEASLLPPNPLQNVDKSKTSTGGQRSIVSSNDGSIEPSHNGRIFVDKPGFWPQVNEFLEELQEPHVHGKLNENDLAGLRNDLKKYGLPCKAVQDWLTMRISKDRSEKRAGEKGMDSQIGWLRAQIRSPDLN